jgi:hypothetical protein
MRALKGCVVILFAWMVCLMMLFGPVTVMHVSNSLNDITEIAELDQYKGYVVTKRSTDLFGNWVTAKKGTSEIHLKCDDTVFEQLSIEDSLGK